MPIKLEFRGGVGFCGGRKAGETGEKPSGETRTNNKINQYEPLGWEPPLLFAWPIEAGKNMNVSNDITSCQHFLTTLSHVGYFLFSLHTIFVGVSYCVM